MKPTIHLAFVDDWELRGDGSGDIERIQFRPMRELARILSSQAIRGTFNAEVMQQLTFRKFQAQHPELGRLADEWDAVLRETFRQGHDVQLHIHPQWREARYENGRWHLLADWSILNHEPEAAREMLLAGKEYLENLLRPIDPGYRCVSFRSGAWCIAPSPFILPLLARVGIVFDVSIVGGVRYHTRNVRLDYTSCEEDFLPFYPVMEDARRVSAKREEIICVPTHHFYSSRRGLLKYQLSKAWGKARGRVRGGAGAGNRGVPQNYQQEWAEVGRASILRRVYGNVFEPYRRGRHFISDLSQLSYGLMREMLDSARRRAAQSGLRDVPVVLEHHTKDAQSFSHVERFARHVAGADDVKCVTLSELARGLTEGRFFIRAAAP